MTDLINLAARLEAACDISGKPTGRHMVPGMTKLAEMQTAMGASEGDREAGELGEVTACMTACIDNEAKLFDALATVAKEAVDALRRANDYQAEASALLVRSHTFTMEHSLSCPATGTMRGDCCTLAKHRAALIAFLSGAREGAAAITPNDQTGAFECMAYDAHCPSMTVRFQVPEGFPLAGGIFRVQRVRTATPEDTARFAHLPDAPETFHDLPAQRDTLIAGEDSLFSQADFCLIGNTVENSEPTGGEAALIFNVSDNATAWSTPWVVGHWSDEAQRWFDHEGYPLTPSHVVKLPSAEVFEKAESIKP
ncbi:hypothetical protein [Sphingobium yanoikuyae]|uniref:hypothetical protein n=1 Tax=Sphingobium yanoikuyae TaxID=13690 RepID=UPI0028A7D401|nr:hypothetical protein [Sphingobium yanoikuyae]